LIPTLSWSNQIDSGASRRVSSRITLHTFGHFAKIFIIIFARINIYLNNIQFPIRLNDQKGLARASFNTTTHWQWRFKQRYHEILISLSTIRSLFHIEYSRLNRIVKRIVEIDLSIEKIEWFADFVFALTTTLVQMQPIYFNFLRSWSP